MPTLRAMDGQGTYLLTFINEVRAVREMDPLQYLNVLGANPDDEQTCVLAEAMVCPVGGSAHPKWMSAGRWVLRFEDLWTTRTTGIVTEQAWLPEPLEVQLPDALVDFAVAARYDLVETDELGYIGAWLVPRDGLDLDRGFERHAMPGFEDDSAVAA